VSASSLDASERAGGWWPVRAGPIWHRCVTSCKTVAVIKLRSVAPQLFVLLVVAGVAAVVGQLAWSLAFVAFALVMCLAAMSGRADQAVLQELIRAVRKHDRRP
jgi:hypothetical protein